jgi:hypothetical protein
MVGVHSLLICTSSILGSPTCHRASQQENTYSTKYQKADRASFGYSVIFTNSSLCPWTVQMFSNQYRCTVTCKAGEGGRTTEYTECWPCLLFDGSRTTRPKTTRPTTTHPTTPRPTDISPHGHFTPWTFRPTDISPHGHLAPRTTRPMDNSPHGTCTLSKKNSEHFRNLSEHKDSVFILYIHICEATPIFPLMAKNCVFFKLKFPIF